MNRKVKNIVLILVFLLLNNLTISQSINNGLNSFRKLDSLIRKGKYGKVNSLIIIKNDKILFEKYYNGFGRDSLQLLYSVTKSITSLLFGIVAREGKLPDLETPIYKFFPEYRIIFDKSPIKKKIKLIHLFTMTAGFQWKEFGGYPPEIINSKDWTEKILSLPIISKPGKKFLYNTGLSFLLGRILQKITGQSIDTFAEKFLFSKLNIKKFKWRKTPSNKCDAGAGLLMRPIDLAKIGLLLLHKGKNIIDSKWLFLSTSKFIERGKRSDYCLQWWRYDSNSKIAKLTSVNDIYFASGFGGQFLWIVPHLNLTVVSTAFNFTNPKITHLIFKDFILKKFEKKKTKFKIN